MSSLDFITRLKDESRSDWFCRINMSIEIPYSSQCLAGVVFRDLLIESFEAKKLALNLFNEMKELNERLLFEVNGRLDLITDDIIGEICK